MILPNHAGLGWVEGGSSRRRWSQERLNFQERMPLPVNLMLGVRGDLPHPPRRFEMRYAKSTQVTWDPSCSYPTYKRASLATAPHGSIDSQRSFLAR